MIIKLENADKDIAQQIFTVFQRSYHIEAQLIGTDHFPPLFRSVGHIAHSETQFYGFIENQHIAGVIEVVIEDQQLNINSLTVDPNYFRRGIASQLLSFILKELRFSTALVETAVVNIPAINLYQQHGFVEFKKWTPSQGIKKVAFILKAAD
jgi:ribosomal protein S18 acetylase RimI-like enzyme